MYEQIVFLFFVLLFLIFLLNYPLPTIDFSKLRLALKEFEVSASILKEKNLNASTLQKISKQLNISYLSITFKNETFSFGNYARVFENFCIFVNHSLACMQIGIR